jgi:hypothetical protein
MKEKTQLALLWILGSVAVTGMAYVAYLVSDKQPALAVALTTMVAWLVGKLTGKPLPIVTIHALETLPPKAAEQAVKRLTTRPPPIPTVKKSEP